MNTLSVIGTAGRKEDAVRINRDLYDRMFDETLAVIQRWQIEGAVSGGAAVSDHLAVRAFNEGAVKSLTLYLPARFENGAFISNPAIQFNPGQTSNKYHQAFSRQCGVDSLSEIAVAIAKGAKVDVHEGFHLRNSEVADHCSHMLAFTFGTRSTDDLDPAAPEFCDAKSAGLKDGGTAHTWGECWKATLKRHVDLYEFK